MSPASATARTSPTAPVSALLLVGGVGSRLRPLTDTLPKCLVPILDRPLIDYWFDRLRAARIRRVRVNNHHHPEQVRTHLERVAADGWFQVQEAYEPELLGSAGTVTANADLAESGGAVVIIYGDNLSDVDLGALLAFHAAHDDPFSMLLFRTPYPSKCGIATLDADGRIVAFTEKPERPASDLANAGVYVVDPEAFVEIAALGGHDLGFDVLPRFVGRMRGMLFDGYHRDVGTHESLAQARADAAAVFPMSPGVPQ